MKLKLEIMYLKGISMEAQSNLVQVADASGYLTFTNAPSKLVIYEDVVIIGKVTNDRLDWKLMCHEGVIALLVIWLLILTVKVKNLERK